MTRGRRRLTWSGTAFCVGLIFAAHAGQMTCQVSGGAPESHPVRTQREIDYTLETERLYRLACELRAELQKSGKGILSVEAVEKLAEIERRVQHLNREMKRK